MPLSRLSLPCTAALFILTAPLAAPLTQGVVSNAAPPASAEPPPPVAREFRAAWVATVGNIDWPSKPGLSTWEQQQELLAILNRAVAVHLNAVILQVRPGTDALYDSRLEPWSEYLTGRMGRAPEPAWDPLAFAVAQAHARGLELHAWVNPYRARYAKPISETASSHISRTHPELVRKYGSFLWMDPGVPEVRRQAERVVLDIVRRYDIDGVHVDDYFYPYKEKDSSGAIIDFPDAASYARYRRAGGSLERDDWRRHNVDLLIAELYRQIKDVKPWVQFGISPISGWKTNTPAGARTFDAYGEIYADTRKWLAEGWCDYFVPQIYSTIESPTPYPAMLEWWVAQNEKKRHLYAGNGLYRVGARNIVAAGGNRALEWTADEILRQVQITRDTPGAEGNVFFSMKGLMQDVDSIDEHLAAAYPAPALVPASPWLHKTPPGRPLIGLKHDPATGEAFVTLTPADGQKPWLWVVQTRTDSGWSTEVLPGDGRTHAFAAGGDPDAVYVSAVDRTGNESPTAVARRRPSGKAPAGPASDRGDVRR
jgi:uncharacterized lipoprotein YddW (UPF0748 family)